MKSKITLICLFTLSLILFILLTVNVLSGNMQGFNETVYREIEQLINPMRTNIMKIISNIGDWFIYAPIVFLFLIIPKSRIKIGVPVALTILISVLLNNTLKHIFAIARPDTNRLISENGYGYPSGHAMNGTVFIGLCAYLFIMYSYKRQLKIFVSTLSFVFMLILGLSRVYLGVHTATDVLAGYLAGMIVLTAAIFILKMKES